MQLDKLADMVVLTIKTALAPVLERVAAAEARLMVLGDLRDRVVTVETKAASIAAAPSVVFDAAPLLAAIGALESRLAATERRLVDVDSKAFSAPDLGDVPDRLLSVEHRTPTKELWDALTENITNLRTRVNALEPVAKDVGDLRERVAVAEVRALVPGPAGTNGANGTDGMNGKDGAAGLGFDDMDLVIDEARKGCFLRFMRGDQVKEFRLPTPFDIGPYHEGERYEKGNGVSWASSWWIAKDQTTDKPGEGPTAWRLCVKKGRDGRDGKDADMPLPVLKVGVR